MSLRTNRGSRARSVHPAAIRNTALGALLAFQFLPYPTLAGDLSAEEDTNGAGVTAASSDQTDKSTEPDSEEARIDAAHERVLQAQSETLLEPISVTATEVAPGGIQIDSDDLDHINPTDIKDVFQGEAAVNVGGGPDVARKSYVNGIEDTNLNVKIDGARQVNSAFHHLGTAIVDPSLLKSVRIETGVGPADVGPGALGGSIAYETKDARDILEIDETFGGWTRFHYDSNPAAKSAIVTTALQHQGAEFLFNGSFDNGGNFEDGDGNEQVGTAPEMQSLLAKFAYTTNNGGRLELNGSYLIDEGIRPNRANFGALVNGAPPTKQDYKRTAVGISYRDEAPTELVNPELVLSFNRSSLFINDLAFGPFRFDLDSSTTSYSGKAANTFTTDLGLVESGSITVGTDFYRDIGKGDLTGGFGGPGVPLNNEETSQNIGAFLQARLNLTNDLRVSAGGRYDYQWFDGIDDTDLTADGPSGNINVEYDLFSGLTGYAGVASTFGPIPLGESAIYNFAGQWVYDGLSSSRSTNYKIGLTGEMGPFSGDVHLFFNEIEGSHDRGNRERNSTRDIEARGLNFAGRYDYDSGFLRTTYTHNVVRDDGDLLLSAEASFHGLQMGDILTFDGAHEFHSIGLRVGAFAEYAFSNDDNSEARQPSYFVADSYAQWTPPDYEFLQLRVDVKNIFDKTYVHRATSAFDNPRAVPFNEPGRSFLLTATLYF